MRRIDIYYCAPDSHTFNLLAHIHTTYDDEGSVFCARPPQGLNPNQRNWAINRSKMAVLEPFTRATKMLYEYIQHAHAYAYAFAYLFWVLGVRAWKCLNFGRN